MIYVNLIEYEQYLDIYQKEYKNHWKYLMEMTQESRNKLVNVFKS